MHIIIIAIKISLNDADNFKDTCINTVMPAATFDACKLLISNKK